eukprot:scaffold109084_cov55-Phaeocystis_antarctica.AAC.2
MRGGPGARTHTYTLHLLPSHRAMTAHGRYLKAKAGKPPAGYVTTYTVAGAPDKVRRACAPLRVATHVHSRAMCVT